MSDLIQAALSGDRGSNQAKIAKIGVQVIETLLKKNKDYGSSVFQVPVLCPNTNPGDAILVRMSDKITRLNNLLKSNQHAEVAESITDTMLDLSAYGMLWICSQEKTNE